MPRTSARPAASSPLGSSHPFSIAETARETFVLIPAKDAERLLVLPLEELPEAAVERFTRRLPGQEPEPMLRARKELVVAGGRPARSS